MRLITLLVSMLIFPGAALADGWKLGETREMWTPLRYCTNPGIAIQIAGAAQEGPEAMESTFFEHQDVCATYAGRIRMTPEMQVWDTAVGERISVKVFKMREQIVGKDVYIFVIFYSKPNAPTPNRKVPIERSTGSEDFAGNDSGAPPWRA